MLISQNTCKASPPPSLPPPSSSGASSRDCTRGLKRDQKEATSSRKTRHVFRAHVREAAGAIPTSVLVEFLRVRDVYRTGSRGFVSRRLKRRERLPDSEQTRASSMRRASADERRSAAAGYELCDPSERNARRRRRQSESVRSRRDQPLPLSPSSPLSAIFMRESAWISQGADSPYFRFNLACASRGATLCTECRYIDISDRISEGRGKGGRGRAGEDRSTAAARSLPPAGSGRD